MNNRKQLEKQVIAAGDCLARRQNAHREALWEVRRWREAVAGLRAAVCVSDSREEDEDA